jgi:hypothetical protein
MERSCKSRANIPMNYQFAAEKRKQTEMKI